ncbi:hypothetical protein F2P81_018662 [Scophthalmus maximus]|uniref:Uncharacterized protein n=1 Tax=Scophthalmus maximus TaxID=52904 RepID=A0A6A4S8T0_SCOMX|nr:hypothetical protein F2P81_018662 [Scophthalmus maximus]
MGKERRKNNPRFSLFASFRRHTDVGSKRGEPATDIFTDSGEQNYSECLTSKATEQGVRVIQEPSEGTWWTEEPITSGLFFSSGYSIKYLPGSRLTVYKLYALTEQQLEMAMTWGEINRTAHNLFLTVNSNLHFATRRHRLSSLTHLFIHH